MDAELIQRSLILSEVTKVDPSGGTGVLTKYEDTDIQCQPSEVTGEKGFRITRSD